MASRGPPLPEAPLPDQRSDEKPQHNQTQKDSDQVLSRLDHGLVSFSSSKIG